MMMGTPEVTTPKKSGGTTSEDVKKTHPIPQKTHEQTNSEGHTSYHILNTL